MVCTLTGAIINTILDPLFIFGFKWGIKGGAWATVIGQFISAMLVVLYFAKFRHMHLERNMFKPQLIHLKAISSLGCDVVKTVPFILPDEEQSERFVAVMRKLRFTPKMYPRHGGTITKKPLFLEQKGEAK